MIQPCLHGPETRFDVAQTLAIRKLSEGHAKKLVHTGKTFYFVIAVISLDAFAEFVERQDFHDLGKNRFAVVH